jgi:GTP-binding protein Era
MHKSGFVNIIGNPNVGKSTLMNALVGEKLAIATAKAQTTRHRIMGIANGDDYQIIYSDTPGILKPAYKMQEAMMSFVTGALTDADILIYVTDTVESPEKNKDYLDRVNRLEVPVFLIINKIDLTTPDKLDKMFEEWQVRLPKARIFPVSAQEKFNLDQLFKSILEALPEGPEYYPKDQVSDKNLRFFAGEIIREKIFVNYQKEIPYCVEVSIDTFLEEDKMFTVEATINVARDSQKGIVIGQGGKMLKKVGTEARLAMEDFFEHKVFLKMYVKVNPNWRDSDRSLRQFGYIQS